MCVYISLKEEDVYDLFHVISLQGKMSTTYIIFCDVHFIAKGTPLVDCKYTITTYNQIFQINQNQSDLS